MYVRYNNGSPDDDDDDVKLDWRRKSEGGDLW